MSSGYIVDHERGLYSETLPTRPYISGPTPEAYLPEHRRIGREDTTERDILIGPRDHKGTNPSPLLINSADRNLTIFPSPSAYKVPLAVPMKFVDSIELVSTSIPNETYIVNSTNNTFYFQDTAAQVSGGTYHTITLTEGNYDIYDFATPANPSIAKNLEDAMNALSASTYTVSVNRYTSRVTITQTSGSGLFNIIMAGEDEVELGSAARSTADIILEGKYAGVDTSAARTKPSYAEQSIGPLIGFSPTNLTGATTYTGSYNYNLSPSTYIIMELTLGGHKVRRLTSSSRKVMDAFCAIHLSDDSSVYQFRSEVDNETYRAVFPSPIEFDTVKVRFTDNYGNQIDFNGTDHSLVFKVNTSSHSPGKD